MSIDVTVYLDGYHGDCCATFIVGVTDDMAMHLVNVSRKCTMAGVDVCGPSIPFSAIGGKIQLSVADRKRLIGGRNWTGCAGPAAFDVGR